MRSNNKTTQTQADPLSPNLLNTIAENLSLLELAPSRSARVKSALLNWAATGTTPSAIKSAASALQKPTAQAAAAPISTRHAFAADGAGDASKWRAVNALVSMQVLHDDGETLSWYARFQPGGHLPAHDHTGDEESLVISGSCYLNDRLMQAGDYQICRAGSRHDKVFSEHGCLLFIRTPKAMLRAHASQ